MKKSVAVIGCTGSIGSQSIDVLQHHPELFDLKLITYYQQEEKAKAIAASIPGLMIGTHDTNQITLFNNNVLVGDNAIAEWIIANQVQIVIIASSSLHTTMLLQQVLPYVEKIALSSKEIIILMGSLGLINDEWRKKVIPVDSEHVAIHQLLRFVERDSITQVILTASGGPFYSQNPLPDLDNVTPALALKHPTWNMGKKVTVDSATLANKSIELMEAHYLFSIPIDQLNVVIHPQSIIHAMVILTNRSMITQFAIPDMRLPIAYALFYPDTTELPYLQSIQPDSIPTLTFVDCHAIGIPIISHAFDCLREPSLKPLFFIIADELAVKAFLNNQIRFTKISEFIRFAVEEMSSQYLFKDRHAFQENLSFFIEQLKHDCSHLLSKFKKQVN